MSDLDRGAAFVMIFEELFGSVTQEMRAGRLEDISRVTPGGRVFTSEIFAEFARRFPGEAPLELPELEGFRGLHEAAVRRLKRAGLWELGL